MANKLLFFVLIFFFNQILMGQENDETVDTSKPTNIYDRINNNIEFTDRSGKQEWGYRFNYSYANDVGIQATLELPFTYSVASKNFGLSDARLRTFYVPYTNYEKTFGGLGVSLDLFFPTGDKNAELGSGNWSLSPGVVFGIILTDSYSIWPNISYRYQFGALPNSTVSKHGSTIQLANSIAFSEDFFVLASPMFIVNDYENEFEDLLGGEVELSYMIVHNMLQIGAFTRQLGNKNKYTQSYRLFARFFL